MVYEIVFIVIVGWIVLGVTVVSGLKYMVPYWYANSLSELVGDIILWPWVLYNLIKYGI